jgi:hypothetical protein
MRNLRLFGRSLGVGVFTLAFALSGCASGGSEIELETADFGPGNEEVGDCLYAEVDGAGTPDLESMIYVSCDDPHTYEVIFVGISETETRDAQVEELMAVCPVAWEQYRDPVASSGFAFSFFYDTNALSGEDFEDESRVVSCVIHRQDFEPITGSVSG